MGRFRKGAASFYIVALSTLVLVIVASSFAITVISEITRTSNDDLSQSAYDSALAGIEDAKIAYMNYKSCIEKGYTVGKITDGDDVTCEDIVYWMQHKDCDMVGHILGRIGKKESGEVLVRETTGDGSNNMNQAYTCVEINTTLSDYRANLSSSNTYKVVKVDLADEDASEIKSIRLSWYSDREGEIYNYNNYNLSANRVTFQPLSLTKASTPPTLALELIQTSENFSMEQMRGPTVGGRTDRATVFLVPTSKADAAVAKSSLINAGTTEIGIYDKTNKENKLASGLFANTNNLSKNVPFVVYCPEDDNSEFMCSAELVLPEPLGGNRIGNTFMFVVYLPYGKPDTDFALEFCTKPAADSIPSACSTKPNNVIGIDSGAIAKLSGMQVTIDSTGRANDLYRRVEVRMESDDEAFAYAINALELTKKGDGSESKMEKNMIVTSEHSTYTDLPDFSSVTTTSHGVRVYPKVDGVEFPSGNSDFKFDVYVDDSLVAGNVRTWSGSVRDRQVVRVEARSVEGYEIVEGVISKTVTEGIVIKPEWVVAYYPVEVNTKIGDDVYERGYSGFRYRIWINNRLVANDVEYYYNDAVKYGSRLVVESIGRAGNCTSARVDEIIKSKTTISVPWSGSCLPLLNVIPVINDVEGVRDGFTFSVYLGEELTPLANNVTSFSQRLAAGSRVRVEANKVEGYNNPGGGTIELSRIEDDSNVYVKWNVKKYTVDVNPIVDGTVYPHGLTGYEFDVYLGDEKVQSRVTDYYNTDGVPYGTKVTIIPYDAGGYVADAIEATVGDKALVMNPTWHRGAYTVDVNVIVNGVTYPHGVYGITFDVYVNDRLVANDWTDFYQEINYGSKVEVKANNKAGFKLANGDMTKYVTGATSFSPIWTSSTISVYTVDVNSVVDGVEYGSGKEGFLFDAYVSGSKVATDVIDLNSGVVGGSIVRVMAKTKTGYTLTNPDETKTANSSLVFKPTWTRNSTTIKYYANGGTGTVADQIVYGGESAALRGNSFVRDGYKFTGWNTKANGTGTSYAAGNIFMAPQEPNKVLELYAQWKESPIITFNYNSNGGTGTMTSHTVYSGNPVTIKQNEFTRADHTFNGWNTKSDGTGSVFVAGQTYTLNYETATTITLYAQWKANYKIIYNTDSPTTIASHACDKTSGCTLSGTIPEKAGYTFKGWCTVATSGGSCSGTTYQPGASFPGSGLTSVNMNLYAIWQMKNGVFLIAANWDNSGGDYDTYIRGNYINGNSFTVNFNNRSASDIYEGVAYTIAQLDQDGCYQGSTCEEAMTLDTRAGKNYYYYVQNRPANNMSSHHLTVTVRLKTGITTSELVNTFTPPASAGSSCTYWNVFAYKNGEIVTRNTCSNSPEVDY